MALSFDEEKKEVDFGDSGDPRLKDSKMVEWLIKKGWFKTPKTANRFLVFVIILCILLTVATLNYEAIAASAKDLF